MKYFKQEDFNKCVEFLKGKPDTIETQQELYKFMHEDCQMCYEYIDMSINDLAVYAKVHNTILSHETKPSWCRVLSDGSQVVWNRKRQIFYLLRKTDMTYYNWYEYSNESPEMSSIDKWLLTNWTTWHFSQLQRRLVAIRNGKFDLYFRNFWK